MQVNVSSFICICGTVGTAAQCHGVRSLSNWTWIWNDFIILHSPSWSDACRSYREIASCNYNKWGSTSPKGCACLWCEKEDYAAEQLWIKAQSGGICCHSLQWGVIVAVDRQPPFHSLFHFLSVSLSHFLSLRGVMIHSTHNLKRYSILDTIVLHFELNLLKSSWN